VDYIINISRLSDDEVKMLIPAVQVDALFARSLVASLELEPLLPILQTSMIPLEVMAAVLAHHIKTKSTLPNEHARVKFFGTIVLTT
jgi:hypothetical protein